MERNGLLSADFAQEFEPLVSAFFILRRSKSLVRIPLFVADFSSGAGVEKFIVIHPSFDLRAK
jgi:hypothetical protein